MDLAVLKPLCSLMIASDLLRREIAVRETVMTRMNLRKRTHQPLRHALCVAAILLLGNSAAVHAQGLVQGPGCAVYVTRGIGMTVLPIRFGVPPEIAVHELKRA